MKPAAHDSERRDQIIAALLWYGTWFASALIAAGVLLMALEPHALLPISGHGAVMAGVAAFIVLPVARVVLMLAIFLHERDYAYSAISALVLTIIVVGVVIEV